MGQLPSSQNLNKSAIQENPDNSLKIYYTNDKYFVMSGIMKRFFKLDRNVIKNCTVGWVLSEVIRRLQGHFGEKNTIYQHFKYTNIVGIKLCNDILNTPEIIDYWLTQYERPMPYLSEKFNIELIYSGILHYLYSSKIILKQKEYQNYQISKFSKS